MSDTMPTLDLVRTTEILDTPPDEEGSPPSCVVEVKEGISTGYLARISRAQSGDAKPWRRRYLDPSRETFNPEGNDGQGRRLRIYADLAEGPHEAHSVLRAGRAQRVIFQVKGGDIAVVNVDGDARTVLDALGWASPPIADDHLPVLRGTPKQVDWARTIRLGVLSKLEAAGHHDQAETLRRVVDATYFVANHKRPASEWPTPAPHQVERAVPELQRLG